jgi:hypothetical protein
MPNVSAISWQEHVTFDEMITTFKRTPPILDNLKKKFICISNWNSFHLTHIEGVLFWTDLKHKGVRKKNLYNTRESGTVVSLLLCT